MTSLRAYWYRGEGGLNLGDALNPLLVRRLTGRTLEWAPPDQAEAFLIGSNLELIPEGFTGAILGTGVASGATWRHDLAGARILTLRGNLTRACIGAGDVPLADLGLLATDLLEDRPDQDVAHGFVRHFADHRRVAGHAIDVIAGPEFVIREVARCARITTSSLHALILADALGIPRRWSPHRSTRAVKWVDYASSYGEPGIPPYVWQCADPGAVAEKQAQLREALTTLVIGPTDYGTDSGGATWQAELPE